MKKKRGRPRLREGWQNTTLYLDIRIYKEWQNICDEMEWGYGQRVTKLMKEDLAREKPHKKI